LIATASPARCTSPRANAPPKQQSSRSTTRRDRQRVIWRFTNSEATAVASRWSTDVFELAK